MAESNHQQLWKTSRWIIIAVFLLSLFSHVTLIWNSTRIGDLLGRKDPPQKYVKLKFAATPATPVKNEEAPQQPIDENKRIIETPLTPTKPPESADSLAPNNHRAEHETKPKQRIVEKALDPGAGLKKKELSKREEFKDAKTDQPLTPSVKIEQNKEKLGEIGRNKVSPGEKHLPRNGYEQLLEQASSSMATEMAAGYQDFIDDQISEGEMLDINTQEYRYIGYFTNMRKAIELVWTYPLSAARRGIHGKVGLKFTILENGKVEGVHVLQTSGYEVLDEAIVSAIRLASPFAPLPKGFNKKSLTVKGTFSYVLNGYYAAD